VKKKKKKKSADSVFFLTAHFFFFQNRQHRVSLLCGELQGPESERLVRAVPQQRRRPERAEQHGRVAAAQGVHEHDGRTHARAADDALRRQRQRAQNVNGETPLHYAVRLLREDLVYLLLAAGADPNIRGRDGRTLLSIAQREAAQTRIADILARPDAYAPSLAATPPRWWRASSCARRAARAPPPRTACCATCASR
jgi:hypothetical protein